MTTLRWYLVVGAAVIILICASAVAGHAAVSGDLCDSLSCFR
jgi:hypothetical protein